MQNIKIYIAKKKIIDVIQTFILPTYIYLLINKHLANNFHNKILSMIYLKLKITFFFHFVELLFR